MIFPQQALLCKFMFMILLGTTINIFNNLRIFTQLKPRSSGALIFRSCSYLWMGKGIEGFLRHLTSKTSPNNWTHPFHDYPLPFNNRHLSSFTLNFLVLSLTQCIKLKLRISFLAKSIYSELAFLWRLRHFLIPPPLTPKYLLCARVCYRLPASYIQPHLCFPFYLL